jgi:uncharacterized lipoprotein NlpE involved in copper resistance
MKKITYLAMMLVTLTLLGCQTSGIRASRAIEGTYVRADNPKITLIINNGLFRQGGTDIHAEGTYTARKLAENKYELAITYHEKLEGAKGTVVVRKDGDFVYTQDDGEGPETKFQRQ